MRKSLRAQIIAAVLVSQALLVSGLTVATVLYSRAQLLSAFDAMLEGRANSILAAIHEEEDHAKVLVLEINRLNVPPADLIEVKLENDLLIWRSPNWEGLPGLLDRKNRILVLSHGGLSYRGLLMLDANVSDEEESSPKSIRKVTIFYAASTSELDRQTLKIGLFTGIASLVLLSLAGLFAAFGVSRALAPVRDLAIEAGRVSSQNWTFNTPPAARTKRELFPLVKALETCIAGLQRAFQRERSATADSAHELKTVAAILRSTLQLLVVRPRSPEEYRQGIDEALEDCDRLELLIQGTLSLARAQQRAEERTFQDTREVDLVSSCQDSTEEMQRYARPRGVQVQCQATGVCLVNADPLDLRTIWINLVQNAIQHSPPGTIIWVKLITGDAAMATVVIEDCGSGISVEHVGRVFDRFYRGDPSRSRETGGAGLGLSICKALVEAYGGNIQISSKVGSGTRVSVSLPMAAMRINGYHGGNKN